MVLPHAIPARPALEGSCTCVWPKEYERQKYVALAYEEEESKVEAVSHPLSTISAVPGRVASAVASSMPGGLGGALAAETPSLERRTTAGSVAPETSNMFNLYPSSNATSTSMSPSAVQRDKGGRAIGDGPGHPMANHVRISSEKHLDSIPDEDDEARKRLSAKSSHIKTGMSRTNARDTPARKAKRAFRLTPEMKLQKLLSYREDLVYLLRMTIPTYRQFQTRSPIAKEDTKLCTHCLIVVAYTLYHCPPRFDSYLKEGCTRTFMTLLDDAVASLENKVRMESISHREIEHILRAELSVVEWRMATKYAKVHKKIGVADLFPMKVGQFAELFVSQDDPPMKPDGFFIRGGKAAARFVGFPGTGKGGPPSRQMAQGAESAMTSS